LTADAPTQEIIKLADKRRIDPYWSLRSVGAALKLAGLTRAADQVLWPDEQGGLAWEVLAGPGKSPVKSKSTGSGTEKTAKAVKSPAASTTRKPVQKGRVVCVGLDDRLHAGYLWNLLESAAAAAGRELILYRLAAGVPPGGRDSAGSINASRAAAGDPRTRYPGWVFRILGLVFPQPPGNLAVEVLPVSEADRRGRVLAMLPPPEINHSPASPSSDGLPGIWTTWLAGHPEVFPIPGEVEIRERFFLARASASAGFLPLLSLVPGEGAEASAFVQRMLHENRRIIVRTADDPSAADSFQVNTGVSLLTPASDTDLAGALNVLGNTGGDGESVFIVEAGRTA
jgi:hypothetical protein